MPDSESGALPLGYTPMTNGTFIILYENVPVCQPLFIKITKVSAFSSIIFEISVSGSIFITVSVFVQ